MTHNVIITDAGFAKDDWTSPISLGLESAQIIEVEAIDVPPALRARSYLYATSFADNSHRFPKLFRWPRLYSGLTHSAFRIFRAVARQRPHHC